jgi:hypothetical protein
VPELAAQARQPAQVLAGLAALVPARQLAVAVQALAAPERAVEQARARVQQLQRDQREWRTANSDPAVFPARGGEGEPRCPI